MSEIKRAIVLAAGQGFDLDGMNKVLIRDPLDSRSLLEKYVDMFSRRGIEVSVVVGYRAVNIMGQFPRLKYFLNGQWKITNNSYSLGLALSDDPCFVLSSDLIFDEALVDLLLDAPPNAVLTENRPSRILTALNCVVSDGKIADIYQGDVRTPQDPEAIGIFKVSDRRLLQTWKRKCLEHGNLFVAQNLPLRLGVDVHALDKGPLRFIEVNTALDYLRLLSESQPELKVA